MTNKTFTNRISAAYFLFVLPISLALFSCEKESVSRQADQVDELKQNAKVSAVEQLLSETNQPGYPITDIQYNSDNSLKSFKTDAVYTTNVTYGSNKVIYTTLLGGNKTSDIVYDMVNNIAVKKTETFYTSGGNVADRIETDYVYESGRLVQEFYRENNLPDGYLAYYDNGVNVTFQERYDSDGNLINKVSYEYYLKLADKSKHLSQFNLKMDAKLFPRFSTNLIETKTLKKAGKNPVVTHFSYKLNNEGYPVSGDVTGPYPYSWTSIWQ
ncbi:hypothetical protein [Dyadobacter sp. CY326]|uniref:hypothetical protein n=1 Tax=Dyadobacter sp. CY326 TaxID=2907300 RepID=UPI001F311530|nr:hypothetical protein [Dyadobacter sp. CY326]MCE7063792.1 hypothetical protein [Dyadobacter sp. CY326]